MNAPIVATTAEYEALPEGTILRGIDEGWVAVKLRGRFPFAGHWDDSGATPEEMEKWAYVGRIVEMGDGA